MVVAAAATGVLSLYGGSSALADSNAHGTTDGSPGVLSGNSVQAPVNVPINVCGNSVDVVGALNPAFGNSCANGGGVRTSPPSGGVSTPPPSGGNSTPPPSGGNSTPPPSGGNSTSPPSGGDSTSPPSGGDTTSPPSGGDTTSPPASDESIPPGGSDSTPPGDQQSTPPGGVEITPPTGGGNHQGPPPTLAHTGGNGPALFGTSAASAAVIAVGAVLFRRGRAASRR
ncbi:chaplin family protein [Streptomyces sp. NPDC051896]|uniref:chaplin family protein n=1 Tax=Streptomyces sp. NPDC051896 TaxID=3155416 RepID=UPI00344211A7